MHRVGVAESHVVLSVPIVRLDPDLPLPSYAHPATPGSTCAHASDGVVPPGGGRLLMPTGIGDRDTRLGTPGSCCRAVAMR